MIGIQYLQAQIQKYEQNPRALLKFPIIAGVLVISLALAVLGKGNVKLFLLPVAVISGVAVVLILLRQPVLGIPGLVVASLLIPTPFGQSYLGIISSAMLLEALMIGLWILDMVARQRHIHLVPSRTNLPLLLFLGMTLVALLNAQIKYYSFGQIAPITAQLSTLLLYFGSAFSFFLAGNLIKDAIWIKRLTWIFLGLSAIYIFGRIIPHFSRIIYQLYQYGSDASIFWIWLATLTFSQLFLNNKLSKVWRVALAVLLAGTLYIALGVAYSWKSGWVPALIAMAVVVFVGKPRLRIYAVALGIVILVLGFTQLDTAVTGGESYSLETRTLAWKLVLDIVKINPILGLGLANYHYYTPLFPILGYSVTYNSHNNYIDLLAQTGMIGLGIFIWFAIEVGFLGWKLKDTVPEGFERAFVVGALGGLVGTLATGALGDWFLPFVYNVGLHGYNSSILSWLFLGVLVALEQLYGKKKNSPSNVGVP